MQVLKNFIYVFTFISLLVCPYLHADVYGDLNQCRAECTAECADEEDFDGCFFGCRISRCREHFPATVLDNKNGMIRLPIKQKAKFLIPRDIVSDEEGPHYEE